jgi:hypothetical protein
MFFKMLGQAVSQTGQMPQISTKTTWSQPPRTRVFGRFSAFLSFSLTR